MQAQFLLGAVATLCVLEASAIPTQVFFTNFDAGVPAELSGVTTIQAADGYAGVGPAGNQFAGNLLRNTASGVPASATILTLSGLPAHTSVDVNFLLAIIDSWDGSTTSVAPDRFTVEIDGTVVFSETFDNFDGADQGFSAPASVQLIARNADGTFRISASQEATERRPTTWDCSRA